MGAQSGAGGSLKTDLPNYLKRKVVTEEEFVDKMRLLIILIQCSSDLNQIKNAISLV